jgi:shikimate dehydrogenase
LWLDAGGQICAHNTDGSGLLRDLEVNLAWSIDGANILVLGAGGAMRGVLGALCERAPATIHIANRTVSKAEQLAALVAGKVSLSTGGLQDIPDLPWDIVINGLSSGWAGDFPDLLVPSLAPSGAAYDLLYSNEPTPFMRWAQMRGVEHVSDGLGMLVEQAADSYAVWHSQRPDTAEVTLRLRGV